MQSGFSCNNLQVQRTSSQKKYSNVFESSDSRNSTKLQNINNDSQSTNAYAYTNNSNAYVNNTENKDSRQINFANPNLDSFRLFTFMNCKEQSFDQRKLPMSIGHNFNYRPERTQYPTKESYQTQLDGDKLVQMIEKSRQRRQLFLKQIQPKQKKKDIRLSISNVSHNSQLSSCVRKSKTPKATSTITPKMQRTKSQIKQSMKVRLKCTHQNNYETQSFTSLTPINMCKSPNNNLHSQRQNKLFRAKSSVGDFKKPAVKKPLNEKATKNVYNQDPYTTINQSFKGSRSKLKDKSNCNQKQFHLNTKQSFKQNEDSTQKLVRKKKQLEKQLLNINTSLLLKKKTKQKCKNVTSRPSKKRAY